MGRSGDYRSALGIGTVVTLLILVTLASPGSLARSAAPVASAPSAPALGLAQVLDAPLLSVPDHEPGVGLAGASYLGAASVHSVSILVSLGFANQTGLQILLAAIANPQSPDYHHYLTAAQFDRDFALPDSQYATVVEYFDSFGVTHLTTYADHESVSFTATSAQVEAAFHTPLGSFEYAGHEYYAPTSTLALPAPVAHLVGSVEGLSSYSMFLNRPLSIPHTQRAPPPVPAAPAPAARASYLTPPVVAGVQYEYAPDFQVAYDQLSLFSEYGYPTNAVVATILWSGQYTGANLSTPNGTLYTDEYVGAFDPTDVSQFFNETLPVGEPHPVAYGVPVLGAPAPGYFASYDSSSAHIENTLDLEMAGSTAPGASLFNVYGGNATNADLDASFAFVLNPNSSYPGLAGVSVISNSWGGTDANDTNWYNDTEEAAARGITVLAASGDSGSDPASAWGPGVFFPASMAYDDFGDVAVGGTTVTLDTYTLAMTSDVAWYVNPNDTQLNGPAGSTGGISSVFAEPSWQVNSEANTVISGAGRGVPDIAALANNTLMTITLGGYDYRATNASGTGTFFDVGGTSVASPLEAGLLADIDYVLKYNLNSDLGFVDPTVYSLGTAMIAPLGSTLTTGYIPTGGYTSALPTLPLFDVVLGANYLYSALPGYDLVTGWGSVDAYNFTMYVFNYQPENVAGQLSAVRAAFNLTGLAVTSTLPGGGVNTLFNASLQQNLFFANSMGAPIYWIQNVVYVNATPTGWAMNFTGWVVYPFYGLYPYQTVYEYNFPVSGLVLNPTVDFTLTTTLVNTSGFDQQAVVFSFGVPGTTSLTLPVPGASYIIGSQSYNYSWQGQNYSNGPYPAPYGGPGGLDPQFGLVGGPSGGIGNFGPETSGNLRLYLERSGTSGFIPGITASYGSNVDQTGETASNLTWTEVSASNRPSDVPAVWNASYQAGATTQGVYEYDLYGSASSYVANFTETGLPAGTPWTLGLTWNSGGLTGTCFSSYCWIYLTNGSYTWTAFGLYGFAAEPGSGTFNVSGANVQVNVVYVPTVNVVTFSEAGLPSGQRWWVNITGGTDLTSTSTSVAVGLSNGTYAYTIATTLWSPHPIRGQFTLDGANLTVPVSFTPPQKFALTFQESGLPSGTLWTVSIAGSMNLSSNGSSIAFNLLNGSYSFAIASPLPGWEVQPANGSVTVNGSATAFPVAFLQPTYAVLFNETGLPAGSLWSVIVSGGPNLTSSSPSEPVWNAINGSYSYVVSTLTAGYAPLDRVANVSVAGVGQTVTITFVQVVYRVSFDESGLSNGTAWSVTLAGLGTFPGTSSSIVVEIPNGSYALSATGPTGYSVSLGSLVVTVAGLNETVNVEFHSTSSSTGTGTPLGLSGTTWLLVVAVIVAAAVVLALLLFRRRPATPRQAPTEGTE